MKRIGFFLLAALMVSSGALAAQPTPQLPFTYTHKSLVPGINTVFAFRLFASNGGGSVLWEEFKLIQVADDRSISTMLGSSTPFIYGRGGPVDFSQQLWVEVVAAKTVLKPRVKLAMAPYALWSASSRQVACLPGDFVNCYEGASATLGVGPCTSGLRHCGEHGDYWGTSCAGQVLPQAEVCNGVDDDCDGQADEDVTCPFAGDICYEGACVLCTSVPGGCLSSVAVTFTGLAGNQAPFTSWEESGFTVLVTEASWVNMVGYGNPGPAIEFWTVAGQPAVEGEIRVTAGGGAFSFASVDLYSSITPIPYTFTGLRDAAPVFTVSGTVPNTFGNFERVQNPNKADLIDTLTIRLVNPASDCCGNPMGLDNIMLSR